MPTSVSSCPPSPGAAACPPQSRTPGTVTRVDPEENVVTATILVGRGAVAIAVGAGSVWMANQSDGTVSRLDPNTNRVVATIHVGGQPTGIALSDGRVWSL